MSTTRIAAIVCLLLGAGGVLLAQTPAPASPPDALLAEVRALRADMNRAASASIRTQLLTARLQLQEQRIYAAARQLTDVQATLRAVRDDIRELQTATRRFDRALTTGNVSFEERDEVRRQMEQHGLEIDQKNQRVRELAAQEADLFNTLGSEQARWTEFNGRLDDIERLLTTEQAR
jgi:hypothetical protein